MIKNIVATLDQLGPVVARSFGLVDYVDGRPLIFSGDGLRPVEGESLSYWRLISPIRESSASDYKGCTGSTQYSIGLRYFVLMDRDLCAPEQMLYVAQAFARNTKALETATAALLVTITRSEIEAESSKALREYANKRIAPNLSATYLDVFIDVVGDDCMNACEVPVLTPGGGSCTFDAVVRVNGTVVDTVVSIDPCVNNTLNILITA